MDVEQYEACGMEILLSFVIPCLNEAATIGDVVDDCHLGGRACMGSYEVVVADNGSTDRSRQIAVSHGARIVNVPIRGYGAALAAGIAAAKGTYVLMGDADSTYQLSQAGEFVEKLEEGFDLVMGNRFQGRIEAKAMPVLHRYLGNPVLSLLGRLFFGIEIGDFHCGLRAFRRDAIKSLKLNCPGMEFASEMVIKASLTDLSIAEIPTNLRPNPPGRKPHLKTWRDGWRHLKFMLSFAPKYSLIPISMLLILLSAVLIFCFFLQLPPLTGPNTLVFAAALLIAATSIFTDYLLTREMIYAQFPITKSSASQRIDRLLGLNRGTDRLFKLAGFAFIGSIVAFLLLIKFAIGSDLGSPAAALTGFLASTLLLIAILLYLAATKLTSYRSFHA